MSVRLGTVDIVRKGKMAAHGPDPGRKPSAKTATTRVVKKWPATGVAWQNANRSRSAKAGWPFGCNSAGNARTHAPAPLWRRQPCCWRPQTCCRQPNIPRPTMAPAPAPRPVRARGTASRKMQSRLATAKVYTLLSCRMGMTIQIMNERNFTTGVTDLMPQLRTI